MNSITILEADVQGAPRFFGGRISQGRGIAHNGDFKFIWEEIGRWPDRLDQVATLTYSWKTDRFLITFVPATYFVDEEDLEQGWAENRYGNHKNRLVKMYFGEIFS